MQYLTDRKRALGHGAAHTGTAHHWHMTLSSYALAVLLPLFLWQVAPLFGSDQGAVLDAFSQPFRAIVTTLMVVIGFYHLAQGARIMLEDYAHGTTRLVLILGVNGLCLAAAATALFALARISL